MATHFSILARRIPMDRGAWWAIVHEVAKCRIGLKWPSTHSQRQPEVPSWEADTAGQPGGAEGGPGAVRRPQRLGHSTGHL